MIMLTVISFNGAPSAGLAASFDELGGTIGRADNNQLVLPDPERSISRVHARIVFRSGAYAVIDSGSNPIAVNGRTLGAAAEHGLKPGDQLQIGGYVLAVSAGSAPAGPRSSDPFADLFGDIGSGLAASPAGAPAPAAVAASAGWPAAATPSAAWPAASAPSAAWPAAATPSAAWPAASATAGAGQIPDDWDPFASHPAPAPPAPAGNAGVGAMQFGSASVDSLDAMFGLGPAVSGTSGADPFGALPAAALPANMAAHADPLQSLARPAAGGAASLANHGSELNAAMPKVKAQLPQAHQAPQPVPQSAPPSEPPQGAVFSWQDGGDGGIPHTVPSFASRAAPSPPPAGATAPSLNSTATASPVTPKPAAAAADAQLLSALLQGLGSPGLRIEALTPDLMRLIGGLLREATRGSVELLVARAALKREMRAEMTMIVARENNPLKFSPSAEVALQYLLSPTMPGFMPAEPAMRDAFDDLRAHQMAVMAGMRSALEGVLQRFNPQQLEGELTQRSALSNLLPALRKARLWDLFQDLFAQLSSEAQDEFEDLFGQAFLDAYEDQLDLLAAAPRAP